MKKNKATNSHIIIIVIAGLLFVFGLIALSGSLMGQNITEPELGDLFAPLTDPIILVVIPLLLLRFSFKKLKIANISYALIVIVTVVYTLLAAVTSYGQTYNYFVQADEDIQNSLENVETLYDKKLQLISQIEATNSGYAEHEKEVILAIAAARSDIRTANAGDQKVTAINRLDSSTRDLSINIENYPNLRSSELALELIRTTQDLETETAQAKVAYNDLVASYNKNGKVFPYVTIARLAGFTERSYFSQLDE